MNKYLRCPRAFMHACAPYKGDKHWRDARRMHGSGGLSAFAISMSGCNCKGVQIRAYRMQNANHFIQQSNSRAANVVWQDSMD